jgi:hypothetical protein
MEYDEGLLEECRNMPDLVTYLEINGGLNKFSSPEGFTFLQGEYFSLVQERIDRAEEMLQENENKHIHFVLARLYSLHNLEEKKFRYMKEARYHARKALEFDPGFGPALSLLKGIEVWRQFIGEPEG